MPMSDVTHILSQIESGDPSAAEQLLPLVYEELRKLAAAKLAQEKPGQTLQATALVHEAYIRLVDVEKAQHWDCGGISSRPRPKRCGGSWWSKLADKQQLKRGGAAEASGFGRCRSRHESGARADLLATERRARSPGRHTTQGRRAGQAAVLCRADRRSRLPRRSGFSRATADRHWAYARAWLLLTDPNEAVTSVYSAKYLRILLAKSAPELRIAV